MEPQGPEKDVSVNERTVGTVSPSEDLPESPTTSKPKVPWYAYIWDYEPGRTKEEARFIQRLDVSVLVILSLGYFIKNLDQTNISNAYVSGMKEDLHMNANQLNLIDVAWTSGYVVGQLPSQVILTKIRPSIWIPSCELVWTVLTFCLAAAKTSNQVVAIRFFVGLVESIFYPAAHMILGSWYKPSELAKRACIFHATSAAVRSPKGFPCSGDSRLTTMLGRYVQRLLAGRRIQRLERRSRHGWLAVGKADGCDGWSIRRWLIRLVLALHHGWCDQPPDRDCRVLHDS